MSCAKYWRCKMKWPDCSDAYVRFAACPRLGSNRSRHSSRPGSRVDAHGFEVTLPNDLAPQAAKPLLLAQAQQGLQAEFDDLLPGLEPRGAKRVFHELVVDDDVRSHDVYEKYGRSPSMSHLKRRKTVLASLRSGHSRECRAADRARSDRVKGLPGSQGSHCPVWKRPASCNRQHPAHASTRRQFCKFGIDNRIRNECESAH
jgi:hypothetical protein